MHRPLSVSLLSSLLFACTHSSQAGQPSGSSTSVFAESQTPSESSSDLPADIFDGDPMMPRLEEVARTHVDQQIERLALWDIAFPNGPEEAVELLGFTVVMITATTQIGGELPPTRIYTSCSGEPEPFELPVIVSRVIPFETDWSGVVGRNRFDGFFLLPVQHLSRTDCKLLMDWAINRSGHVISELGITVPVHVPVMPPLAVPAQTVIWLMLEREYPFLFEDE